MSIIICSTRFEGCGHVSFNTSPKVTEGSACPICRKNVTQELLPENVDRLTDTDNRSIAITLLTGGVDRVPVTSN